MGFFSQMRDNYSRWQEGAEQRAKDKLKKAQTKAERDKVIYDLQMDKIERRKKLDLALAKAREAELRRKKAEGKLGDYSITSRIMKGIEKAAGNSPRRASARKTTRRKTTRR